MLPAALERPLLRASVLLLRERDAGDVRTGDLGEVEGESAPAASDIEDAGLRLNKELCRQVALFGELGVVERLSRSLEISAAILLVGVKEECVEPAVEVVMVRHIAPRAGAQVELLQPPEQIAYQPSGQRPGWCGDMVLPQQDREHVGDRALLDDERAIHIGFAQSKLWIEQDAALRFCVGEAHGNGRPAAVAEGVGIA